MSNELQFPGPGSQRTVYSVIYNRTGQVWSTSGGMGAFENFTSGNWGSYAVSCSEQGVSNFYTSTFPTAIVPGVYGVIARNQAGGSPLQTDVQCAQGDFQWNGSVALPLSDLATSGQVGSFAPLRVARGVMIQNFPIYLKSSADHVSPLLSGVISGQIARDGSTTFGPLQSGAFTETGMGYYNLSALTSGDLLANTVKLLFTGTGISGGTSDPLPISFILQRTSGSL